MAQGKSIPLAQITQAPQIQTTIKAVNASHVHITQVIDLKATGHKGTDRKANAHTHLAHKETVRKEHAHKVKPQPLKNQKLTKEVTHNVDA